MSASAEQVVRERHGHFPSGRRRVPVEYIAQIAGAGLAGRPAFLILILFTSPVAADASTRRAVTE
jgi:hypothetical protein